EEEHRAHKDDDKTDKKKQKKQKSSAHDLGDRFFDGEPEPGVSGLGSALPFPRVAQEARDEPSSGPLSNDPTRGKVEHQEEESYPFTSPMERYHPLPSLLPPRYIVPGISRTSYGWLGLVATGGTDVLRRYFYSGYISYRTDGKYLGWGGAFLLN